MNDKKVCLTKALEAQSIKIFVPGDGERANEIASELAKSYDFVTVTPQDCDSESGKCAGSEVIGIRRKEPEETEDEYRAIGTALNVVRPADRENRPTLQNMSDDTLVYKTDCN